MAEVLLNTTEIAAVLRVHPKHVYRLLKRGLPARRVGAEWRFSQLDVLAWSGGRAVATDEPVATARGAEQAAPSLVAATGDVVISVLLRLAAEKGPPLLGVVQADTGTAARLLRQRAILAAGAHAGGFPSHVGDDRVARLHLVEREVGLALAKGLKVQLPDLAGLRLASRPPSAGMRHHLDEALRGAGLDPERIHRKALALGSNLEVALAVAAGRADVGLCTRALALQAGLGFLPLAVEAYGLIIQARDLGDQRVVRLCEVAQGRPFHAEVGAIPGYRVEGAGDIRYDA